MKKQASRTLMTKGATAGSESSPPSLMKQMSLYFFPERATAAASPVVRRNSATEEPEILLGELETLLVASPAMARAVLKTLLATADDSRDRNLDAVVSVHASAGSAALTSLTRHLADAEFAESGRNITVWREKTELVAVMQSLLRSGRAQVYCGALCDPFVKKLLHGSSGPDADSVVVSFIGRVHASFAYDLPVAVVAALKGVHAACGDTRVLGLFLFLRLFIPYLTHPARWKDVPAKRERLTGFSRRLGQVVAVQRDVLAGSLLEPLVDLLLPEGPFYAPLLERSVAPRLPAEANTHVAGKELRAFVRLHEHDLKKAAGGVAPQVLDSLSRSGRLKRSNSCTM